MNGILVRVRDLRPGDFLIGSKRTVVAVGQCGQKTLVTVARGTYEVTHEWNSGTTMRILRKVGS